MRLIQTIKNIFKIEDLRARLLYTFGIILLYRLGKYVTLPGIDPSQLANLKSQTNSGLMGLLDMFSGGAFSQASIFALGIMPYISASIVVQLLGIVFPYFQKLQKEGESGRRKMNQYTRYLTIAVLILQGPTYLYQPSRSAAIFSLYSVRNILYNFFCHNPYCRYHVCNVAWRKNYR